MTHSKPNRTPIFTAVKWSLLICIAGSGILSAAPGPLQDLGVSFHASARAAASEIEGTAPKELLGFASEVVDKLSFQPPFTAWKQARQRVQPLGPGTRSWLVTLYGQDHAGNSGDKQLGYLIISVTPDGAYKLIEYGAGPDVPYSTAVLQEALGSPGPGKASAAAVTLLYGGPALAAWKVSHPALPKQVSGDSIFLDAITGEALPETEKSWAAQAQAFTPSAAAYGSDLPDLAPGLVRTAGEPYDPYENLLWIAPGTRTAVSSDQILQSLNHNQRVVFTAAGKQRNYHVPLPVYGYQIWSSQTGSSSSPADNSPAAVYLLSGCDEDTFRWIALDALNSSGTFVLYPEDL